MQNGETSKLNANFYGSSAILMVRGRRVKRTIVLFFRLANGVKIVSSQRRKVLTEVPSEFVILLRVLIGAQIPSLFAINANG